MGHGYRRGGGRGRFVRGYGRDWWRGTGWDTIGRGNPYLYCNWNPDLPRGWWRFPPDHWKKLGWDVSNWPSCTSGIFPVPYFLGQTPEMEKERIEAGIAVLKNELEVMEKRPRQLNTEKEEDFER